MAFIVEEIGEDTTGEFATPEEAQTQEDVSKAIIAKMGLPVADEDTYIDFVGEEVSSLPKVELSKEPIAENETSEAMVAAFESIIDKQSEQLSASLEAYGIHLSLLDSNLTQYQRNKRQAALESISGLSQQFALESETDSKPGFLKRLWEWIRNLFKSIGQMLKKAWEWFLNLFKKEEKQAQAMITYIEKNIDAYEESVKAEETKSKDTQEEPTVLGTMEHAVDKDKLTITIPAAQLSRLFTANQKPLKPKEDGKVDALEFMTAIERGSNSLREPMLFVVKDNTTDGLIRLLSGIKEWSDTAKFNTLKPNNYFPKPKVKTLEPLVQGKSLLSRYHGGEKGDWEGFMENTYVKLVDYGTIQEYTNSITITFDKITLLKLVKHLDVATVAMSTLKAAISKDAKAIDKLEQIVNKLPDTVGEGESQEDMDLPLFRKLLTYTIERLKHPALDIMHLAMSFFLTLLRIVNSLGFKIKAQLDKNGKTRIVKQ